MDEWTVDHSRLDSGGLRMTHPGRVCVFLVTSLLMCTVSQTEYCPRPAATYHTALEAVHQPDINSDPRPPKKRAVYVDEIENNYFGEHAKHVDYLAGLRKLGGESSESVENSYPHDYPHGYPMEGHGDAGGYEPVYGCEGTTNYAVTTEATAKTVKTTSESDTTSESSTSGASETTAGSETTTESGTSAGSETTTGTATETTAGSRTTAGDTGTTEGVTRAIRAPPRLFDGRPMNLHRHVLTRSALDQSKTSALAHRVVHPVQHHGGSDPARPSRNAHPGQKNRNTGARYEHPLNVNPIRENRHVNPNQCGKMACSIGQNRNKAPIRIPRNPNTFESNANPAGRHRHAKPEHPTKRNIGKPNQPQTYLVRPGHNANTNNINKQPANDRLGPHHATFPHLSLEEYMSILKKLMAETPKTAPASGERRQSIEALLNVLAQHFPASRDVATPAKTPARRATACLQQLDAVFQEWAGQLSASQQPTPAQGDTLAAAIQDMQDFQTLFKLFQRVAAELTRADRMSDDKQQLVEMEKLLRFAEKMRARKVGEFNRFVRPSEENARWNALAMEHLDAVVKVVSDFVWDESRNRVRRQSPLDEIRKTIESGTSMLLGAGSPPGIDAALANFLKISSVILNANPSMRVDDRIVQNILDIYNTMVNLRGQGVTVVAPDAVVTPDAVTAAAAAAGSNPDTVGRQRENTITVDRNRDRDRGYTIDELVRLLRRRGNLRGSRGRQQSRRRDGRERGHDGRFDAGYDDDDYLYDYNLYDYVYEETDPVEEGSTSTTKAALGADSTTSAPIEKPERREDIVIDAETFRQLLARRRDDDDVWFVEDRRRGRDRWDGRDWERSQAMRRQGGGRGERRRGGWRG